MTEELRIEMKNILRYCTINSKYSNDEEFVREFKYSVGWGWVLETQNLSESFIREFKNSVDWDWISYSQKISEEFRRVHKRI